MPSTVLITGTSSGIGLATARLFARQGWNVAATMREPSKAPDFGTEGVAAIALDVTSVESVEGAVADVLARFKTIDVVVNNAGYGTIGPFEAATSAQIERQFATNVFGPMHVIRAVLPTMREQRRGVVINVSSVGGRLTFPLYSLYHATKFAIEGLSESLQYELGPLGIRVKLVEPGPIKTDFYARSQDILARPGLTDYDDVMARGMATMGAAGHRGASPEKVAQTIFHAATDGRARMRYPVNSHLLLWLRKVLPDGLLAHLIGRSVLGR